MIVIISPKGTISNAYIGPYKTKENKNVYIIITFDRVIAKRMTARSFVRCIIPYSVVCSIKEENYDRAVRGMNATILGDIKPGDFLVELRKLNEMAKSNKELGFVHDYVVDELIDEKYDISE